MRQQADAHARRPISISGLRPSRSTIQMATNVKSMFTPPTSTVSQMAALAPDARSS